MEKIEKCLKDAMNILEQDFTKISIGDIEDVATDAYNEIETAKNKLDTAVEDIECDAITDGEENAAIGILRAYLNHPDDIIENIMGWLPDKRKIAESITLYSVSQKGLDILTALGMTSTDEGDREFAKILLTRFGERLSTGCGKTIVEAKKLGMCRASSACSGCLGDV